MTQMQKILFWAGMAVLLTLLMGGLYVLYYGNQHIHFLFWFAEVKYGFLSADPFIHGLDPLKAFSAFMAFSYQHLDKSLFYGYQIILNGIYLYSLVGIADHFYQIRRKRLLFFIFMALALLSYAVIWPGEIEYLLYHGVATQAMEWQLLLPNSFAALLFLSVFCFVKQRPGWAVLLIGLACLLHPAHLIGSAALTVGYMLVDYLDHRRWQRAFLIGLSALLLVFPVILNTYAANSGADAAQVQEGTAIIAGQRIPFHTQVRVWWGADDFVRLLISLAAIFAARRKKLGIILLVLLVFTAIPTILMFVRPSYTLGILQLWRVSIVLMPLASTSLMAAIVADFYEHHEEDITRLRAGVIAALLILGLAAVGAGIKSQVEKVDYHQARYGRPLYEFVRQDGEQGDLYLLPPRDAWLFSFRVDTGIPIFADWNAHPWTSPAINEWSDRIAFADEFFARSGQEKCPLLPELVEEFGVTHVLLPVQLNLKCEGVKKIYQDDRYRIFEVVGQS